MLSWNCAAKLGGGDGGCNSSVWLWSLILTLLVALDSISSSGYLRRSLLLDESTARLFLGRDDTICFRVSIRLLIADVLLAFWGEAIIPFGDSLTGLLEMIGAVTLHRLSISNGYCGWVSSSIISEARARAFTVTGVEECDVCLPGLGGFWDNKI